MTDADIQKEFWMDRFYKLMEQGKTPTADYFDTDFVDDALEQWAKEDEELAEIEQLKAKPNDWEEVSLDG